jgi:hypothetical protein
VTMGGSRASGMTIDCTIVIHFRELWRKTQCGAFSVQAARAQWQLIVVHEASFHNALSALFGRGWGTYIAYL